MHRKEDQRPRWRDRHEAVGEKQGVDSRDEVRHSEKTDQLFVNMMMKYYKWCDRQYINH